MFGVSVLIFGILMSFSPERRAADRQKHPIKTTGNVIILLAAGSALGLAIIGALQLLAIHLMRARDFLVGV